MQGVSIGRRWRHSDTHPGNNVWSLQAIWFLNGLVSGLLETADMGGRRIRVWRNSRRERRKPRRFHYFVGMKSRSKKTRSTRKASSSWRKLWSTNRFFLKIGCPEPVQIWSKQWNRNIIIWNNEWTWLATPQLTTPATLPDFHHGGNLTGGTLTRSFRVSAAKGCVGSGVALPTPVKYGKLPASSASGRASLS